MKASWNKNPNIFKASSEFQVKASNESQAAAAEIMREIICNAQKRTVANAPPIDSVHPVKKSYRRFSPSNVVDVVYVPPIDPADSVKNSYPKFSVASSQLGVYIYRGYRGAQHHPKHSDNSAALLASIPRPIIEIICSLLDERSIISMARTNQQWRLCVEKTLKERISYYTKQLELIVFPYIRHDFQYIHTRPPTTFNDIEFIRYHGREKGSNVPLYVMSNILSDIELFASRKSADRGELVIADSLNSIDTNEEQITQTKHRTGRHINNDKDFDE